MSGAEAENAAGRPYCVVYSMGRVGSSSLHEDLDRRGFQARHAHFLSDHAMQRKVRDLVQPSVGPFEVKHWTGQLVANLETRRRLEAYRRRRSAPAPVLLTLVRDPATWFCSNLVQNWEGISRLLRRWEKDPEANEQQLVSRLYARTEIVLQHLETVDTRKVLALRDGAWALREPIDRLLYNAIVAPFVWMEVEYCTFLDARLTEFEGIKPEGKTRKTEYGVSLVGRLEDAETVRRTMSRLLDCDLSREASRTNVSQDESIYGEVMARFAGFPELLRSHRALKETTYRRVFRY